jgi:hypothetical protein
VIYLPLLSIGVGRESFGGILIKIQTPVVLITIAIQLHSFCKSEIFENSYQTVRTENSIQCFFKYYDLPLSLIREAGSIYIDEWKPLCNNFIYTSFCLNIILLRKIPDDVVLII